MQSTIIVGKTQKDREDAAIDLCKQYSVDPLDCVFIRSTNDKGEVESIGIADVKRIQESLFLAPFHGTAKAVILTHCDTITLVAQNALLKILEEPPVNTYIMLLAEREEVFLPTVLSRCTIMQLAKIPTLSSEEKDTIQAVWQRIRTAPLGEKLALAQSLTKKKEDTETFLTQLTLFLYEQLGQGSIPTTLLRNVQYTNHMVRSTNANHRLLLEHFFLSLPY